MAPLNLAQTRATRAGAASHPLVAGPTIWATSVMAAGGRAVSSELVIGAACRRRGLP